jgi:malate dehydrogenase (oxaloacetate-decarboxylating)
MEVPAMVATADGHQETLVAFADAPPLTPPLVRDMAERAIVFALALPDPEILPDPVYEAGARVVATGRSDHPNR